MAGVLYVVSTPIGNPEDLTFRALRILREVQWIAAEDTQQTQQILKHYAVTTPLTTYQNLNKEEKAPILIAKLLEGQHIALVTDAGTPAIFDPGYFLISQAIASGIRIVPIPGPSATLAAAAASGLEMRSLVLELGLPSRSELRQRFLEALRKEGRAIILCLQSTRIRTALKALSTVLGTRRIALAVNLTMPHEEILRGTAAELLHETEQRSIRGEATLVIEGVKSEEISPEV